jgi:hypothetical protein
MTAIVTPDSERHISDLLFDDPFHHRVVVEHVQNVGHLDSPIELMVVLFEDPIYSATLGIAPLEDVVDLLERVDAT